MDIPSGWKSFHLKDVTYESRMRAASESATHLVVFGVNNQTGLSTVSKYHADNLDRYKIVKPGMFAYNPMRLNIGSIGYCNETIGEGLVSPDYVVFGCKENKLNSKYFSHYLQEHEWRNWVQRAGAGSVRVRIYYKDIGIYPIVLPSISEQQKIAEILSTWDYAIAKTEQLIAALQLRKKGLMQRLLTGEVRFPGFEKSKEKQESKTGRLPVDWKIKHLGELATLAFSNVDKKSNEQENTVRLCNYTDVFKHLFITNDMPFMIGSASEREIERFSLEKSDVVITKDSETSEEIAEAAVVVTDLDNVICGYHLAILRPKQKLIDGIFLMYLLHEENVHFQFARLANGITRFGLTTDTIQNALIPLPSLPEQKKIASALKSSDDELTLLTRKLKSLKVQKKGLMQRLLTGQVRVKV
jgi:type I restriction enzyme, S subunit